MNLKKKLAIVGAIVGLTALVPTIAWAAGDVSICSVECTTFDCWVAQLFSC